MLAVQGYFDGAAIRTLEDIDAKPNQRVIITVLDDFVEPRPIARRKSLRGILARYANATLVEREKGAWERAAEKAYAEYLADPVTYSHEEIMKEFGLK